MYKFGSRDITDVVFKAKTAMKIGSLALGEMQPALYIDTATASTIEQSTTTVYATGGKGNTRLITWEGEKTLTFTVTDALLSPVGIAILTGAGILGGGTDENDDSKAVHVHQTGQAVVSDNAITIYNKRLCTKAPIFVLDYTNDVIGKMYGLDNATIKSTNDGFTITFAEGDAPAAGTPVFVDFYETHKASKVSEIQIDSSVFAGNFYVEANTLFRNTDGKDLPAVITIPNAKIQSNMTISMSATGDPSTFDFVMDAMPGYTIFNHSKKVMCVIQTVDETVSDDGASDVQSVMEHPLGEDEVLDEDVESATEFFHDTVTGNEKNTADFFANFEE